MARHLLSLAVCVTLVVAAQLDGSAAASSADLRQALIRHYPLSRVEVQNPAVAGAVIERGALLTLQADVVPAARFRVIQANTKSPRFHARDYARVEIRDDGAITAGAGELRLQRGTRLVVLDTEVAGDTVRLFTHTTVPIVAPDGTRQYGCTEFVFRMGRTPLELANIDTIEEVIERWLPFAA